MGMIPPELFEHINSVLSNLALCLIVIFLRYFATEYANHGFTRARMASVVALSGMVGGEVLIRFWLWLIRYLGNDGIDTKFMIDLPLGIVPLLGVLLQAAGYLCMIRIVTPDDWGERGWLACAGTALAVSAMFGFFRPGLIVAIWGASLLCAGFGAAFVYFRVTLKNVTTLEPLLWSAASAALFGVIDAVLLVVYFKI